MIDLYFFPTPNTRKVLIFLEEAALDYRLLRIDITKDDQFDPAFLTIGKNNKVPAILDTRPADGGAPIPVFESGAILFYLADKTGRFIPTDLRGRTAVMEWVMFQMANQGPKFGERSHFKRAVDKAQNGDLSYAMTRFSEEVARIHGVLERQLGATRYVAGADYTIADMILYPWAARPEIHGLEVADYPNVSRWLADIAARPAVARAMVVELPKNDG